MAVWLPLAVQRRVEECSLNAWPALQQVLYDGWVLRFANAYTKRANSANPIYPSTQDLGAKISTCERLYRGHGLRPIFRLTPFANPPELDRALEARGYQVLDPTLVLYLDLGDWDHTAASGCELVDEELDDWMSVFWAISGHDPALRDTHRQMLSRIIGARHLAVLRLDGLPVACGLSVEEDGLVGLFDVVVSFEYRRRGLGTRLMQGLLHRAAARATSAGIARPAAYLQVMEVNEAARRLYGRLGFQELYRYWYRVPGQ